MSYHSWNNIIYYSLTRYNNYENKFNRILKKLLIISTNYPYNCILDSLLYAIDKNILQEIVSNRI